MSSKPLIGLLTHTNTHRQTDTLKTILDFAIVTNNEANKNYREVDCKDKVI